MARKSISRRKKKGKEKQHQNVGDFQRTKGGLYYS